MTFSNSPLISYTKISPNKTLNRNHSIDRITPHCVVGQCSVETLGNIFAPESRQASCQYGIGVDGRIAMYCEEKSRSWCSSSASNDHRAVTIECASDTTHPYAMNEKVYQSLIALCADICKRNGKKKLLWFGDKDKTLAYKPKADEMVITVHRWFANKSCPGDWLYSRLSDLANQVNKVLGTSVNTKVETPAETLPEVHEGDVVKIANSATYYDGVKKVPTWVKNKKWIVKQVDGNKVIIDKSEDGKNAICSPIHIKFLTVVKASAPEKEEIFKPYLVKVDTAALNIRKGAGVNYPKTGCITDKGIYTIVAESKGQGSDKGWGKLKSGIGWISLDYCIKK